MVFWILTVIVAFFISWGMVIFWKSNAFYTVFGKILAGIGILITGFCIWALVAWGGSWLLAYSFIPNMTAQGEPAKTELYALQSRDTIEGKSAGSIFASYGYVNGTRVLSYITKTSDGGMRLGYLNVSESVVYEDSSDSYILDQKWVRQNGWIYPWILNAQHTYVLHVPTGSVVSEYNIAP